VHFTFNFRPSWNFAIERPTTPLPSSFLSALLVILPVSFVPIDQ
jgi:hypothetical protein